MLELNNEKIKRADVCDAAEIAVIENVCFSSPYSEASLADMLASPLHPSFVYRDEDGKMLGYLLGNMIVPEGDLLRIAVLPDARRQGTGRMLLEAFLSHLRDMGCTVCFLDVREHNLAAQALYKSYGFAPFDRRKGYYHLPAEDAIVMRLSLEEEK